MAAGQGVSGHIVSTVWRWGDVMCAHPTLLSPSHTVQDQPRNVSPTDMPDVSIMILNTIKLTIKINYDYFIPIGMVAILK